MASEYAARVRDVLKERTKLNRALLKIDKDLQAAQRRVAQLDRERTSAQRRVSEIDQALATLDRVLGGGASLGGPMLTPPRPALVPAVVSANRSTSPKALVSGQRATILEALRERGTAKTTDLALATGIGAGSISAVLSGLVADGLVVRVELGTYRAVPVRDDAEHEELPPETPDDRIGVGAGGTVQDDVRAWLGAHPGAEFTAADLTATVGRNVSGGILANLRDREGIVEALGDGRWRAKRGPVSGAEAAS